MLLEIDIIVHCFGLLSYEQWKTLVVQGVQGIMLPSYGGIIKKPL